MRRKTVTTEQFDRRIWLIRVKTVATIVIKSQWRISMLAKAMIEKLNEQINLEFYSSNLYLQMSAWCEDKGFEGAATFLRQHAVEERQHMERLFTYVSETGAMPMLGAIDAPPHEIKSQGDIFRNTHEHEYHITQSIKG